MELDSKNESYFLFSFFVVCFPRSFSSSLPFFSTYLLIYTRRRIVGEQGLNPIKPTIFVILQFNASTLLCNSLKYILYYIKVSNSEHKKQCFSVIFTFLESFIGLIQGMLQYSCSSIRLSFLPSSDFVVANVTNLTSQTCMDLEPIS